MKSIINTLFIASLLVLLGISYACRQGNDIIITTENKLDIPLSDQTIAIALSEGLIKGEDPGYLLVKEAGSEDTLVSQLLDMDGDGEYEELIFQSDYKALEKKQFIVSVVDEKLAEAGSKTYARFVPERMDDFAWENDRIAFRMYGPALEATGEIGSGIDVWSKKVDYLVLDKWYEMADYHNDHGEGCDHYKVGPSRGCGGSAYYVDDSLITSNNYVKWEILANGPIRSVFKLTYAPVEVDGKMISETKTISLDAGSNLNRFENNYIAEELPDNMDIVVGIVKRKGDTEESLSTAVGWMSYWQPEVKTHGNTACGLVFDPGIFEKFSSDADNNLVICRANKEEPFVYYAGAGWTESGQFSDQQSWEKYLEEFSKKLASPIEITIN